MKRCLSLFSGLMLISVWLVAQEQLENPGFEEWEDLLISDTDTIREPVQWSSLKESDNPALANMAPVVCFRSTDAHSGMYSVKLTNVESLVIANGIVTNGRIHPDIITANAYTFTDTENDQWNTSFSSRPDSIVGWFKYSFTDTDTLQVKVSLHQGFGKQPDPDSLENWIGIGEFRSARNTDGQWMRFSAPFKYMSDETPEYALVVINSGSKLNPAAGSVAHFDDLEMIYNASFAEEVSEADPAFIAVTGSRTLWLKNMNLNHYSRLEVYDITGRRVWSENLNGDLLDLSPANLKKGIYVASVKGPEHFYNQKFMLH